MNVKNILVVAGIVVGLISGTATSSLAAKKPPHCKTLSTITTAIQNGTVYNQDGTSETSTILKTVIKERCRGKIVVHTFYRYE